MSNPVEELTRLKSEYDDAVKNKGQEVVDFLVKGFLEKYPDVDGLAWTGYTPYFNDGDACVFSIGEVCVLIKDKEGSPYLTDDAEPEYGVEDAYDSYSLNVERDWSAPGRPRSGPAAQLAEDLDEVGSALRKFQDVLLVLFGDHVQVIATRNGYDVDEYYHD